MTFSGISLGGPIADRVESLRELLESAGTIILLLFQLFELVSAALLVPIKKNARIALAYCTNEKLFVSGVVI